MGWPVISGITLAFVGFAIGSNETAARNRTCLKVAVETFEPFVWVEDKAENFRVSGIMTDVLQIIGMKLGRCIEFKRSQTRGMGIRLANGSWIGLLELVHKKEVDFSGVIMAMNDLRSRTFDYSTTLVMDDRILVHKWPGIRPAMDGVFKPFTSEVWLYFGLMTIMACGVMVIIHRERLKLDGGMRLAQVQQGSKEETAIEKEGFLRSLWNVCIWTYGSILSQGYSWNPTGNSIRVMTGLWLLLSLVINTVYRSNLMSMLILPKVQLPFDSLEELIQSRIKTFVPLQSIMYNAIMEAPVGTPMNRLRAQALFHYDTQKAARDIIDGKCAGFVGQASFRYVMHNVFKKTGKCPGIYMASEIFFEGSPCSLAFPKGSPLLHKINTILLRLKEQGILSFMYNTAIAHSIHCSKLQIGNTSRALELGDFYGVFLIYIGGLALSLVVFAVEKIVGDHGNETKIQGPRLLLTVETKPSSKFV